MKRPRASRARAGALKASAVIPARERAAATRPKQQPATETPAVTEPVAEVEPEKSRTTKYTANLDETTALAFDGLALAARRSKGRPVDKSELLRVLVLLAADDASLRDQAFALLPDRGRGRS